MNSGTIVNTTVGDLTGSTSSSSSSSTTKRSFDIDNVLYSINDYSGNTHTNRVLGQDGNLYDVKLDNDGNQQSTVNVGSYSHDMTFSGHNHTVTVNGQVKEYELQSVQPKARTPDERKPLTLKFGQIRLQSFSRHPVGLLDLCDPGRGSNADSGHCRIVWRRVEHNKRRHGR